MDVRALEVRGRDFRVGEYSMSIWLGMELDDEELEPQFLAVCIMISRLQWNVDEEKRLITEDSSLL